MKKSPLPPKHPLKLFKTYVSKRKREQRGRQQDEPSSIKDDGKRIEEKLTRRWKNQGHDVDNKRDESNGWETGTDTRNEHVSRIDFAQLSTRTLCFSTI